MSTAPQKKVASGLPRLLIRCACFVAATVCALPLLPWRWASMILPALSPYIALGAWIGRHTTSLILLLGLPALAVVLLRPRFICRFICPVGLLNDQASRLRPGARGRFVKFPRVGDGLVLLTLGSACLGYPLFLWLDPFSIFNGAFSLFHRPLTFAAIVSGATLLLTLLLSAWRPNLWCQRLCPLGATQDLLTKLRRLQHRLPFGRPRQAPAATDKALRIDRRAAMAVGIGGVWAVATRKVAATSDRILPPGGVDRTAMGALCVRCGNCLRACPQKIIKPDAGNQGIAAFMTPILDFTEEYCHPDCYECTRVCPSGAIAQLTLSDKQKFVIGIARVSVDDCLAAQGGECNSCTMACLYDAIGGDELIASGEGEGMEGGEFGFGAPVVNKKKCVGCGACELVCPSMPKAIFVRPKA